MVEYGVNRKIELRAEMRAERARLAREVGPIGEAIARHALAHVPFPTGAAVAGYAPMGDEADPLPLLKALVERGFLTGLPVTPAARVPLVFRRWAPGGALVPARFGLSEPPATAAAFEPTILLVPLLAFDRAGHRLGYGAGYYDRTLEKLRASRTILAVGIAYSGQEVDEVGAGPHDQKLAWIVTERAARRFL
jgi:5-formyltetrahydrofolate cyclo-ligase